MNFHSYAFFSYFFPSHLSFPSLPTTWPTASFYLSSLWILNSLGQGLCKQVCTSAPLLCWKSTDLHLVLPLTWHILIVKLYPGGWVTIGATIATIWQSHWSSAGLHFVVGNAVIPSLFKMWLYFKKQLSQNVLIFSSSLFSLIC